MRRRRPRLGSIYRRRKKLPDGRVAELPTWWIKYSNDGQPIRESTGTKHFKAAESFLKNRIKEIEAGIYSGPQADRIRIEELLEDLLINYQVNGRAYKDFAEPIVRLHLRPCFGSMRARKLTTPDVERFIRKRKKEGAANATINRETAILKRAFNLAYKQDPPKVMRVPHIPSLSENNVRKGFLEHSEFVVLRRALPEEIRPLITFAFYTGCRRGEILSLKWSQIDLARRIVRLDPGTTKNDEPRLAPLPPELYEVLAMQKSIRDEKYTACPWVFFRKGDRIRDFRGAWDSACNTIGLVSEAGKPARIFHDLRRTGVRNLRRAGVSEEVAMKISGHKTQSVFHRYNITSEKDIQEAGRLLGRYIEEMKSVEPDLGTLLGTPKVNKSEASKKNTAKLLN